MKQKEKKSKEKDERKVLTLTGLLMEGLDQKWSISWLFYTD
jgi:hypothetical protein